MGELGVIKNDLGHVRRSLDGLHRKADRTNGCVQANSGRLTKLETREVVTTAECNDRRLTGTRRILGAIVGAVAALATGWILHAVTSGGG